METVETVGWGDLERFLRNAPGGILLEVAQPGCPACEVDSAIDSTSLPEGIARARLLLDPDDPADQHIAESLGVEATPTFIGFCMGEELGRTHRLEEAQDLIAKLQACGSTLPKAHEEGD